MSDSTTSGSTPDANPPPSIANTTEAIKARIEREIKAVKNRIEFKQDEVKRLQSCIEELKAQDEAAKQTKELSLHALSRLNERLRQRAQLLESEIRWTDKITLSTTNVRKSCHVPVYYSRTNFKLLVVAPNITCGTLVRQALACFTPDTPEIAQFAKYIKMYRRGVSESIILDEMRYDKVRVPSHLFDPTDLTLVCNTGRKPGLWEDEDLASAKLRDQDAISFLHSLSFDSQRGCGVNGGKLTPLGPNAPAMLPPLYLVKRSITSNSASASIKFPSTFVARGSALDQPDDDQQVQPPWNASLDASVKFNGDRPERSAGDSNGPLTGASTLQEQSRASKTESILTLPDTEQSVVFPDTSREVASDIPKQLAAKKNSSFFSLGERASEGESLRNRAGDVQNEVGEDTSSQPGDSASSKKTCFKQWCLPSGPNWSNEMSSRLKRFASSSRANLQTESSAFEAFAALILLGDRDDEEIDKELPFALSDGKPVNSEMNARQRILNRAADLMDFAWLGRNHSGARLYCRQLGFALKLDRPPRSLWAVVFKDIAQGSGDRLAHSIGFDEFRSQYKTLRRWEFPGEDGLTYGAKIDELVNLFKADMKSTYTLVDLAVPVYLWSRRMRALLLIVAFVLIVVVSLANARAFVEVAGAFPVAFSLYENLSEYYGWSRIICSRLIRSDIGNVVVRQHRIKAVAAADCSNTSIYQEFSSEQQQHDYNINGTEWAEFAKDIAGASSAHGRFADYSTDAFPLQQTAGTGQEFGFVTTGLDVSSRAVVIDFDVVNEALDVTAHGEYITEFDSNGAAVSRLAMTSKTSSTPASSDGSSLAFAIYTTAASVLLGAALILALLPMLRWVCRGNASQPVGETTPSFTNRQQFLFLSTFFCAVAFGTTVPLIVTNYNTNLLAVSLLSIAFALSVLLYSLERSWAKVLAVFDSTRTRLFSVFVQYVVLVVCYAVALEGWYSDRPYISDHYGQTGLAVAVLGIVQNYAYMLFPAEHRNFSDFVSIIFGMFFIMQAMTLVYIFFSIIVVGFRMQDDQPNWGLFNIWTRKVYRPVIKD